MVISLPRTTMREPEKASCTKRSNSSRWPSRPTIRWLPGTRIFTWVGDTGYSRLPAGPPPDAHAWTGPAARAGGPRQLRPPGAADHVQVKVPDAVLRVLPDVQDQPVAAFVRCPRTRPPARATTSRSASVLGVGRPDRRSIVDVTARDHEDVGRRLRVDVPKRERALRTRNHVGGQLACDDPAEQAVAVDLRAPQNSGSCPQLVVVAQNLTWRSAGPFSSG